MDKEKLKEWSYCSLKLKDRAVGITIGTKVETPGRKWH